MKRSKIFQWLTILFVVIMMVAVYDISRRTVFPGTKPDKIQQKNRQEAAKDTVGKSDRK